ncbi:uncharacterized protein LOC141653266 [Silene latifolia]|uniref:uncharacterized protein LOC141653266 n=1 Tax=Silene latifolia TaxID=37657 RepID=UPI003D777055
MTMYFVGSLFILAIMVHHSSASFCVCKAGLQSTAYQKVIDYACGQGVDCSPIGPNGQCANSNGLQGHCSFAANSYYSKNSAKGATCDFEGSAQLTNSDPSGGGCSFSATSGSGLTSNGTTTPGTTVPTTSPTTTPVSGGGGGIMPITPVSGTGTSTPGTSTGAPTSSTGTGTSTNPTTTSPYSTGNQTSTGVLGGGMGMAPTASSMDNHGNRIWSISLWSVLSALVISAIACI